MAQLSAALFQVMHTKKVPASTGTEFGKAGASEVSALLGSTLRKPDAQLPQAPELSSGSYPCRLVAV